MSNTRKKRKTVEDEETVPPKRAKKSKTVLPKRAKKSKTVLPKRAKSDRHLELCVSLTLPNHLKELKKAPDHDNKWFPADIRFSMQPRSKAAPFSSFSFLDTRHVAEKDSDGAWRMPVKLHRTERLANRCLPHDPTDVKICVAAYLQRKVSTMLNDNLIAIIYEYTRSYAWIQIGYDWNDLLPPKHGIFLDFESALDRHMSLLSDRVILTNVLEIVLP